MKMNGTSFRIIKSPFRIKNSKRTSFIHKSTEVKSLYLILMICLFFLVGCENSAEDDVSIFLKNVMIRERGLYVLLGSKPMSTFSIENGFPESTQEHKHFRHARTKKLWENWVHKEVSLSSHYKFIARKSPFGDHSLEGLFINVPNSEYILKHHYTDFAKLTGQEFSPGEILQDLSNAESLFWTRVFRNHYLSGLLLGFGEKNAYLYDWGEKNHIEPFVSRPKGMPSLDQISNLYFKSTIYLEDLYLPLFGSSEINDPVVEKYRIERKYILSKLRGKNFTTEMMRRLQNRE